MKKFELNGKKYNVLPMNFNMVCDLEDKGISINDFASKPFKFARAYVALAANKDDNEIGNEIEEHLKKGNTLESIYEVIGNEIEESDFFQTLKQNEKAKTPTMEK